ncbi:hypothetical protein ASF88_07905 [Leifsonia sp. Leaf336]|uniref:hypothetical protein n=1 Tax=Leifsonia sp. Leaf336 TaxID=1736341 RepID=UPI0006FA8D45|nr:hypothetical protein [Leifsonia sp. Leaf336]KQR54670.1 hypothetical protein ASF88_07905 [Leifsonia sp. Leaf336]
MDGYRFQIASDVSSRDGLAVELVDASGARLLEVFRDDDRDGELTFNSFGTVSVSFAAAAKLLEIASREFMAADSPTAASDGSPATSGETKKDEN